MTLGAFDMRIPHIETPAMSSIIVSLIALLTKPVTTRSFKYYSLGGRQQ
jgi:hypothetical protein